VFECGLGNPDKKYKLTRHNLGFNILDSIIKKNNCLLTKKDKNKELYKGKIDIHDCLLCKPLTYMNLSGPIIGELINFYKIPKSKIIIIHDDLDLTLGKIKIKTGGGNGGHNGLRSVDQAIGKNYKRLRVGIGHPGSKELVSPYSVISLRCYFC
jgi:PTH1 family peptidyl-tRNA hydrolase